MQEIQVPDPAHPSLLFAAIPFPAFALNARGEVIACNPAAERAYGWSRDALGRPPGTFPQRAFARLLGAIGRVLASGREEELDLACADPAGVGRPVRLRASAIGDPPSGVLVVDIDAALTGVDGATPPCATRLQAVLDAIPAPIFFKDAGGSYLGCNCAFERYVGITRERLVGRSVFDITPSDLAQVYHEADEALFASGGTRLSEERVQWADGTLRDVIFHNAAIKDAKGRVTGLAGVMLDVTEQRAAERALRDRLLQQAALTMIATQVLNEEDPHRLVDAALRLTVDAQDAAFGSVLELIQENGRRMVRCAAGSGPAHPVPLEDDPLASRLITTGGPLVSADGAALGLPVPGSLAGAETFSLAAVLVGGRDDPRGVLAVYDGPGRTFGEDGVQALETIAHVLAVGLGRRSALEAARSTEASFRLLVESVPDLIVIHERGRIVYANPAMQAVLGRPLDAIIGSGVLDLVHPDDHAILLPYYQSSTVPMPAAELRIRDGGGAWVTAEFVSIAIEMAGRPVRVAIGRDLTERTQVKERLARAQRLAAIGTLAAGVTHELNNPLTFVLSNVEHVANALRRLRGAPPDADGWDEALHALDDAFEGAERMRMIIRDLRTMARADEGSVGPAEVRRLLEYAANLAWNEVKPRARLIWDIASVPPVRGSEGRLGQVFLNLIVNAAHAIPEGNPNAHVIRLSASQQADGKVAISVTDTGAGISPENLTRIFDPFFTTKPAGLGTGLGLWVCHNIVSAYGGTLDVSSALGKGTTFRVILPAADPGEFSVRTRREDGRSGRPRRRLLVVDDEPLVAATVRRQLASDFVVDAASGAIDALTRIGSDHYDAVVCDVVMEGPNGLQFLDTLRQREPSLADRVLFVTGGASPGCTDLLAASGVPWLAKPFDGRQLRKALRELLASAA